MSHIQQWLQFFQNVSCFYRELLMLPLWHKYPNHTTDIWESLAIFLEGYGFERQGSKPDYPHAAVDALFYYRDRKNGIFDQEVVKDIYNRFSKLLNNQNLNKKNNPLYSGNNNQQNSSLIQAILNKNIPQENLTLTTYLKKLIKQNEIQEAHEFLKKIRGAGDKIASLFLRDLTDVMNITLTSQTQNRHLLQPIDIWVKRTVQLLTNDQNMADNQIREWIVRESVKFNLNPERVNMGIWFFCSQIVKSNYRLETIIKEKGLNYAQTLINSFRDSVRKLCKNC